MLHPLEMPGLDALVRELDILIRARYPLAWLTVRVTVVASGLVPDVAPRRPQGATLQVGAVTWSRVLLNRR